jgi:hypothetical protein
MESGTFRRSFLGMERRDLELVKDDILAWGIWAGRRWLRGCSS